MATEITKPIILDETYRELMEKQNNLLAAIASGNAGADFVDATFQSLLDGTNTTTVFYSWWPLSAGDNVTKYDRLVRFAKMLATYAKDKTYTLRYYLPSVSSDYNGTPLDDLADGREAAPLVTDASDTVEDWAENDPFTWYVRANALSLSDGTMNVLAVEGEADFDLSGATAPVYCFAVAYCMAEWEDSSYYYESYRMSEGGKYKPLAEGIDPTGARRWLTWHAAFYGGKTSAGGITSGAGLPPMPWVSASAALPMVRITSAYEGEYTDCDAQYIISQWRLRHWTLSNSGKAEGCNSYNCQYTLAAAESDVKRVLLTAAQAANILVGSGVCLGEKGSNTNTDRNQSYNHDITQWAKVISKEVVTVDSTEYTALTLDLDSTITTTTTMLVSTMPWPSGTTEALQRHCDGSITSLTNGKYPYRVAGIEMEIGSFTEQLDPLWNVSVTDEKYHYAIYSCRDSVNQATSITSNYVANGEIVLPDALTHTWHYIKRLGALVKEAVLPIEWGGSSATYQRDAFYSSSGPGLRSPWRFGLLSHGGPCGVGCCSGPLAPGTSYFHGVPRLAGAGKKRGESA